MSARMNLGSLTALTVIFCTIFSGCAATTVVKNPGPKDKGIRYYRPKPYLSLKPGTAPGTVDVSLVYLPDYNEEYSIRINAGLGTNNTSVKLTDGWNLSEIDVNVDSKANELLTAATGLIPALGGAAGGAEPMTIEATDVPLGLYEAVTGIDDCGQKQMYGWRYIGFMPFAKCPIVGSGGPYQNHCDCELWGLVWYKGKLTFRTISQISSTNSTSTDVESSGPAPAPKATEFKADINIFRDPKTDAEKM